ncbi:MAG TPA: hypothetical protein VN523_05375 [Hyphomicrobiaceae bacterium]|jgi:hypothetical protein|nr:hypothetical protein [Hyphomicrobiaceae bacterium]
MFRALINDAKAAATSVVAKYLARASVAVPFLIAAGFAIAAITHMLIQRFGAVLGCWILAAGFTLIGLVATLLVKVKEHKEEVAEKQAEAADTADVANEVAAQALMQAPLALVGTLLSTPLGPKSFANGAKLILRNLPLVVLLGLIALLFWPTQPAAAEGDQDLGEEPPPGPVPDANGAYRPKGNGVHRERAA